MDAIYSIMDAILPFSWLSFDFMKNFIGIEGGRQWKMLINISIFDGSPLST